MALAHSQTRRLLAIIIDRQCTSEPIRTQTPYRVDDIMVVDEVSGTPAPWLSHRNRIRSRNARLRPVRDW